MIMPAASSSSSPKPAAAFYDYQYCGKGCPTQDLAYFLCATCDIENDEEELVSYYHNKLTEALLAQMTQMGQDQSSMQHVIPTLNHLKESLQVAYADYCRFMSGWGYWGTSSGQVQDRTRALLDRIDGGKDLGSEEAYERAIRQKLW